MVLNEGDNPKILFVIIISLTKHLRISKTTKISMLKEVDKSKDQFCQRVPEDHYLQLNSSNSTIQEY